MRGQIGGNTRWGRATDRTTATETARAAFLDRFEREVDPEGVLPPVERAKRAKNARRAYFTRLSLKSAKSRRRRAGSETPPAGEPESLEEARREMESLGARIEDLQAWLEGEAEEAAREQDAHGRANRCGGVA